MTLIRGFLPGLNRMSNLDLKPVPWIFLRNHWAGYQLLIVPIYMYILVEIS